MFIAAIVGGSLAFAAAIVGLVWLIVRSGPEIARVAVKTGEPFRVSAELTGPKVLSLWCEVDVAFRDRLELEGPLAMELGGRRVLQERFALGPRGTTTAGSSTRVKKVWVRGSSGVRGQARIAKITASAGPTSVVVEGTITAGPGTEAKRLDLFLGAR